MPLYEYLCDACAHGFEEIRPASDEMPLACPKCGKPEGRRILSAVHLKGNPSPLKDYGAKAVPGLSKPSIGGGGGGCGGGGFSWG